MAEKDIHLRDFSLLTFNEVKNIEKEQGFSYEKGNYRLLSERGKYLIPIQDYLGRMTDTADDMQKVLGFIKYMPHKRQLEKMNINRLDCLKYHTEVLYHKSSTVLDLMKLMVNEVYEYNLSEENCTWDNLKNRIKNPAIKWILDAYHKSFKQMINARNYNTHRAYYKDKDSDEIQQVYFLLKQSEKFGIKPPKELAYLTDEYILKYRTTDRIKDRIKFVESTIAAVESYKIEFEKVILVDAVQIALKKQAIEEYL